MKAQGHQTRHVLPRLPMRSMIYSCLFTLSARSPNVEAISITSYEHRVKERNMVARRTYNL